MSKSQTLDDLKKTGVKLSQTEAQEIHTRIGQIAKGQHESGELFEIVAAEEMKPANNVQPSTGFTAIHGDNELDSSHSEKNEETGIETIHLNFHDGGIIADELNVNSEEAAPIEADNTISAPVESVVLPPVAEAPKKPVVEKAPKVAKAQKTPKAKGAKV